MDDESFLDHYRCPYHRGHFPDATHSESIRNDSCGDEVTLQIQLTDETVESAWFVAKGCILCQAASSILCQHMENQTLKSLSCFDAHKMLALLGFHPTPRRQMCALLPFKAMKSLIYKMQ